MYTFFFFHKAIKNPILLLDELVSLFVTLIKPNIQSNSYIASTTLDLRAALHKTYKNSLEILGHIDMMASCSC